MGKVVGSRTWYIPDAYYPVESSGKYPSHEAICVLNPGPRDAVLEITLYFEDREKMGGFRAVCKAERANHVRLDMIKNDRGEGVPRGVPYAIMVRSDVEVIIQYSRMDTSQAEMALMTTMAYPVTK